MTFRQYTVGTEYLENGILCIVEACDENQELTWVQSWGGLQVSELATFSSITIIGDRLYIVVSKELNTLDIKTGEILWSVANLGSSFEAPLVDEERVIYVVGQYAPYLSAVNNKGTVLWKVDSDELYGAYSVNFDGEVLALKCYKGLVKVDKNGAILR